MTTIKGYLPVAAFLALTAGFAIAQAASATAYPPGPT